MDQTNGQQRVMAKEKNNRRGPGKGGKVPVKSGAKSGFASNKVSKGKIRLK